MTISQFFEAMGLGLAAGIIGGMAGIGGSLVMLPGLALLLGFHDRARSEQHVYQAAALAINVLVAIPATWQHGRAGVVRKTLVARIMPAMVVAMVLGVLVSDRAPGGVLTLLLAVFIAAYSCFNIVRALRKIPEIGGATERSGLALHAGIGAASGFVGGLLGLGGGAVMVPTLQLFARVRLREAIATSSAAMVVSSLIGAAIKLSNLGQHGHSWREAAVLVAAMAPGAILGGGLGAHLAHKLPLRAVRLVVSVLLLLVAVRLLSKLL